MLNNEEEAPFTSCTWNKIAVTILRAVVSEIWILVEMFLLIQVQESKLCFVPAFSQSMNASGNCDSFKIAGALQSFLNHLVVC